MAWSTLLGLLHRWSSPSTPRDRTRRRSKARRHSARLGVRVHEPIVSPTSLVNPLPTGVETLAWNLATENPLEQTSVAHVRVVAASAHTEMAFSSGPISIGAPATARTTPQATAESTDNQETATDSTSWNVNQWSVFPPSQGVTPATGFGSASFASATRPTAIHGGATASIPASGVVSNFFGGADHAASQPTSHLPLTANTATPHLNHTIATIGHAPPKGGHSQANRVTDFWYDWRDRDMASKSGVQASENDGTHRPITFNTYDNLNEITEVQKYNGDGVTITVSGGVPQAPSASLLRAQSVTAYDDQGRVYQTAVYDVNQSTGAVSSTALTTNVYRNHRGQVMDTSNPGGEVDKSQYDGAGRVVESYISDGAGGTSWTAAGSVTNDNVLEQTATPSL